MGDLILYITLAAIGYLISARLVKNPYRLSFTGPAQTVSIACLVVSMGGRMGANDEVIKNLNSIGIYALVMTAAVIMFSVIAVSLVRRGIKLDRFGYACGPGEKAGEDVLWEQNGGGIGMTLFILITVTAGMFLGYFTVHRGFVPYELFDSVAAETIRIVLCVLLFLVGMDMGKKNTFIEDVKSAGLKVFLIPGAACAGTLAAAVLCSFFLPLSLRESLAIASGFGWYSLAPGIIMKKGLVTISAVSFMHNIFRELAGLVLIPAAAKKIGYIEAIGMPGAGASDVCLPFIVKATRSGMALYAFVTGVTLSALVPVLVPFFIG